MNGFSVLRSRLTGNLTTPDDTAGVDAFHSTIQHRPDAVVRAAAEADVVDTVRFAHAGGMPLQLHATGRRTAAPVGQPPRRQVAGEVVEGTRHPPEEVLVLAAYHLGQHHVRRGGLAGVLAAFGVVVHLVGDQPGDVVQHRRGPRGHRRRHAADVAVVVAAGRAVHTAGPAAGGAHRAVRWAAVGGEAVEPGHHRPA